MAIRNTVICDTCGKQYLLEIDEELPPYWFVIQVTIADGDGLLPVNGEEHYSHFCSQPCITEFCQGDELRELAALADSEQMFNKENQEDPDTEGDENAQQ